MHNIRGDLFDPSTYKPYHNGHELYPDAICITTNGFVKKNGEAVMGRGCAKRAAELMPGLPEILGSLLNNPVVGNTVMSHGRWNNMQIVTFPVKPRERICAQDKSNVVRHMQKCFSPGQKVPGWACVAELELIERSAKQLVEKADGYHWRYIVLPRPGCGAGELSWTTVETILQGILDDRFYAITF